MAKKKNVIREKDHKRFLKVHREHVTYRPVEKRVLDYNDVVVKRKDSVSQDQASRCMDCGVPFCHWGCPIGNNVPEWNSALMSGQWEKAFILLNETNNLPEMTSRVCPALCEAACVLGVNDEPITVCQNEQAIIEYAFKKGYIKPNPPKVRTGKKVAVIGSGPAGLAAAAQLNKAGHSVTVYERAKKIGGLLRYGIPDFKLEKWVIDRRQKLMEEEGIVFKTGVDVGTKVTYEQLQKKFDAVCLTGGSRVPRDLPVPGRDLNGVHFAMDYLTQSNKLVSGEKVSVKDRIDAKGKRVVVIGGGDTGSDCVGTANRQGATSVTQLEVMPKPAEERTEAHPWPQFPVLLKTTSSHKEGCERQWSVLSKEFVGEKGAVTKIKCVNVDFSQVGKDGRPKMVEVAGSGFEIKADLVILAVGFVHPEHDGLLDSIGVQYDARGNVKANDAFMSSVDGVFAAGDMRKGQSLIVWAISEGRKAAHHIDAYLMGKSSLPYM